MKSFTMLFMMVLVSVVLTASVSPVHAQGFTLHIYATDGVKTDTLTLGESPTANDGWDNFEMEEPPAPPDSNEGGGDFDVRFISPNTDTTGWNKGKMVDIRHYFSSDQIDTFAIQFQSSSPSDGGGNMQFSWNPSELAGFRWQIIGAAQQNLYSLGSGSPFVVPTSYPPNSLPNYRTQFNLVKSSSVLFRSFCYEYLALDVDDKTKLGKAVKAKPWHAYFTTEFVNPITNTGAGAVNELLLKFGDAIDPGQLVVDPPGTVTNQDLGKNKAFLVHYGSDIPGGDTIRMSGLSLKGKAAKVTAYTYKNYPGKVPKPVKYTLTVNSVLYLPMPNTVNLGEWLFTNGGLDATNGIVVGSMENLKALVTLKTPKDTFKYVYHPKYKDVLKSLVKTPSTLHNAAGPFGQVAGKLMVKKQKSLPPDKSNNSVFAEALTLKLNSLFSSNGLTPTGFGNLSVVNNDGGAEFTQFVGKTFDQIVLAADTFLTAGVGGAHGVKDPALSGLTAADLYTVLYTINCAFSGTFDTSSWSGVKPVVTGAKYASDYSWIGLGSTLPSGNILRASAPSVPLQYSLQQNYPNPFNPTTTIQFTLPEDAYVSINVYNMLGQEIAILANREEFTEGANDVEFDASSLASGVYFYRILVHDLSSGQLKYQQVRKMMLLK